MVVGRRAISDRRAFMKMAGSAMAYATPVVAALGSASTAAAATAYEKVKSDLDQSLKLVTGARRVAVESLSREELESLGPTLEKLREMVDPLNWGPRG